MYMAILVHQACRPEISGLEQTLTTAPRFVRGQHRCSKLTLHRLERREPVGSSVSGKRKFVIGKIGIPETIIVEISRVSSDPRPQSPPAFLPSSSFIGCRAACSQVLSYKLTAEIRRRIIDKLAKNCHTNINLVPEAHFNCLFLVT